MFCTRERKLRTEVKSEPLTPDIDNAIDREYKTITIYCALLEHIFFTKGVNMNSSIAIQILPMNADTAKVIEVVDHVIALIKESHLTYEVSAFETTIEGEYNALMGLLNACILKAGEYHDSVFVNVKIAYNSNGVLTIDEKTSKHRTI